MKTREKLQTAGNPSETKFDFKNFSMLFACISLAAIFSSDCDNIHLPAPPPPPLPLVSYQFFFSLLLVGCCWIKAPKRQHILASDVLFEMRSSTIKMSLWTAPHEFSLRQRLLLLFGYFHRWVKNELSIALCCMPAYTYSFNNAQRTK